MKRMTMNAKRNVMMIRLSSSTKMIKIRAAPTIIPPIRHKHSAVSFQKIGVFPLCIVPYHFHGIHPVGEELVAVQNCIHKPGPVEE
jgi:hypothetical protein